MLVEREARPERAELTKFTIKKANAETKPIRSSNERRCLYAHMREVGDAPARIKLKKRSPIKRRISKQSPYGSSKERRCLYAHMREVGDAPARADMKKLTIKKANVKTKPIWIIELEAMPSELN